MIMTSLFIRTCRAVLLVAALAVSPADAQAGVSGVGPIIAPTSSASSTVVSSAGIVATSASVASSTILASATTTTTTTTTTGDAVAAPTSTGPIGIFVDLGSFLGNLSESAPPMNPTFLNWQLGERMNISWTTPYQNMGAVDLFLMQRLQNSSQTNQLMLLGNYTGDSTLWTVDVQNLSIASNSPINPNMFYFQLSESGSQLPIVMSQNITIANAQANETAATTSPAQPTATFTSPPSPGGSHKLSTGAVVGIAVGATAFVAFILLGLVHLICSRRRRNNGSKGSAAAAAAAMERAMPVGFDPVEGPSSYRQVQMSQPDNSSTAAASIGLAVGTMPTASDSNDPEAAAAAARRRELWSPPPQLPPIHVSDSRTNLSDDPQPVPMSPSRPVSSLYSGHYSLDEFEDREGRRSVSLASSPSRHASDYLSPSPTSPRPSSQLFSDSRPWPLRDSALHGNPP